ncbi:MAG: 23S rRNA (adenine(2503)-C(2))-methyltransferase RlmN [bacterium]
MRSILELTLKEIEDFIVEAGYEPYRARQVLEWIYDKVVLDFEQMSSIPKSLREELSKVFSIVPFQLVKRLDDDETTKFLFNTSDNLRFESVVITHPDRVTLCVSTQIGCPVGCRFCATGESFSRNLNSEEIIGEYIFAQSIVKRRISGIVFMGMGEPLLNEKELYKAISKFISDFTISPRHITISTSGIPQGIVALARNFPRVKLAFSLWSADPEVRKELVPTGRVYHLEEIIKSIKEYIEITHNRISIEYTIIKGINDSLDDAYKLVKLFKGLPVFFNIIPYNPKDNMTKEFVPDIEDVMRFISVLERFKKEVHLRSSKGAKISAACGQLRGAYEGTR